MASSTATPIPIGVLMGPRASNRMAASENNALIPVTWLGVRFSE